jgi:hypothetical protein
MKTILLAAGLATWASATWAQSLPSPPYQYGVTRTVGQINNDFARKQDYLGAVSLIHNVVTTADTANNIGLTGANLTGGSLIVFMDVQTVLAAGCTLTLPSVATTVLAMQSVGINPVNGYTYELDVYNNQSGAFNYTLTADSGATWTLLGTAQTVAKGTVRKYLVTLTTLTAGTMQSLGEFTVAAPP